MNKWSLFPSYLNHFCTFLRTISTTHCLHLPKPEQLSSEEKAIETKPNSRIELREKTGLPKEKPTKNMVNANRHVLCVAEKNDAAKNIARLLSRGQMRTNNGKSKYNKNYTFNASFRNVNSSFVFTSVSGHLMSYAFHPRHKNWIENQIYNLFDGEIQQILGSGMKDVELNLRVESRKAQTLVIWTDCDREGEYIGNEIVKVCLKENPRLHVHRARFSEITEQAVRNALHNLVAIDQNSVNAVDCRMELDLRIGAAFTRLQTLYLKRNCNQLIQHAPGPAGDDSHVISYGSCQFPTLGFIVERFKENKAFLSEEFWRLVGKDDANPGVDFLWERPGLTVQIFDKDIAQAIMDSCNAIKHLAQVKYVDKHEKTKWRPFPLDTVQLEKLGNRHLKFTAKRVMTSAEKLYQKGFISYPRTETNSYTKDFDLAGIVASLAQNNVWGGFARSIQEGGGPNPRNGAKNDQAHPPIHPVKDANRFSRGIEWGNGLFLSRNEMASPDDFAVYELICRHFLASVSRNAIGDETKIKVEVNGEMFTATGLVVRDQGFYEVYPYEKWADKTIPAYTLGQKLPRFNVNMRNGFTEPPPLLSEADLISLMDKKGIGTDATHAEHIEKIKLRQYVRVNPANRFEPTNLGMALVDGHDKMEHSHKLSKPELRAALETDLVKICQGGVKGFTLTRVLDPGQKTKDAVLREQLRIYKEIFKNAEVKINFLGQSLQVLQQTQNVNGNSNRRSL